MESRINDRMGEVEMMFALTRPSNNPNAISALIEIIRDSLKIDPQNMLSAFGPMLTLDMCGIYEEKIYILWSDLCNRSTTKSVALLWAVQLGILDKSILLDACSRQDYSGRNIVDVDDIYRKVCEMLTGFHRIELSDG